MLLAVLMLIYGCQFPITPEAAVFLYEDEIVSKGEFAVLANRRIFATMAFLNGVGFNDEIEGQMMYPIRQLVRENLHEKSKAYPGKFAAWKRYFQNTGCARFQFQDYALSFNTDYPFKRIRPYKEIGYPMTYFKLGQFPEVLNDFWETVELNKIWDQIKPLYLEEIKKYDPYEMKDQLDFMWRYLKLEQTGQIKYMTIPNVLNMRLTGLVATYENYVYIRILIGEGATSLEDKETNRKIAVKRYIKTKDGNGSEFIVTQHTLGDKNTIVILESTAPDSHKLANELNSALRKLGIKVIHY